LATLMLADHTESLEIERVKTARIVARHLQEVIDVWRKHFGG